MADTQDASAAPMIRAELKTPKAAAIAGILFALLLTLSLVLLRTSIPGDPTEAGDWLKTSVDRVVIALNLVPFAGIAFMWFLGVLRDRLGAREDKFFATVFLGSGLLFLSMIFVAASAVGALVLAYSATSATFVGSAAFVFARAFAYDVMHIYAFKMAAVFMISTSSLAVRGGFMARWLAVAGYVSAAAIIFGGGFSDWALFVFPCWVLIVSVYILIENMAVRPHGVLP